MSLKHLLSAASLLAMAVLVGCSSEPKTPQAAPQVVSGVQTITVGRETVPEYIEAIGTIRAEQTSQLASQVMGNVVAVHVREGDMVKRGQVVAAIDDTQARAALDRAAAYVLAATKDVVATDAEYRLAASTLKRYQTLVDKEIISAQQYDEVNARFAAAEARRDLAAAGQQQARAAEVEARTLRNYTIVHAPFDGIVTEKRVDVGVLAVPGTPLVTVEDTRRYRLEVSVDQGQISLVTVGQNARVVLDGMGKQVSGRVVQIVPAADTTSRSFLVKVELPRDSAWRSGVFGRAYFARGNRDSILLPREAIVDRGQLRSVYVLNQNQVASLRYLTLGRNIGNRIEVLSGLEERETVIVNPSERDLAGKRVEVRP